jgi:hypothetical protein
MQSLKALRDERKQRKRAAAQVVHSTRVGSDGVRVSAKTKEEEEEAKRKERQNEFDKIANKEAGVRVFCVVM